ncbi:MAG: methyltransferase domain-containing protein [Kiloniellales bacterium]|nr:methyltransferase domain-containing protein [Kiloniellales bacterium]
MTTDRSDPAAQFSRQAEAYVASASHAKDADLDIVEALADCRAGDRCLDVATGPGNVAFRLARTAGLVVACDIAPGMLQVARRQAEQKGLTNLCLVRAASEALPFPAGAFDAITCRIAPHHFRSVPAFLAEAARCLKPGGRFVLEDSLAPETTEAAAFLEAVEKSRDASHVHTLSRAEWIGALAAAGLRITDEQVFRKVHDFGPWIERTGLERGAIDAIVARILAAPAAVTQGLFELDGDRVTRLHDRKLILRAEI